jgi:hypothetical protein
VALGGWRIAFKYYFKSEPLHRHVIVVWKRVEGNIKTFEVLHMVKVKILICIVKSEFSLAS